MVPSQNILRARLVEPDSSLTLNLCGAATAVNPLTSATLRPPTFCPPPPRCRPRSAYLANELPPLVHADVEAGLRSFDAHAAPKRVRLHYEFG